MAQIVQNSLQSSVFQKLGPAGPSKLLHAGRFLSENVQWRMTRKSRVVFSTLSDVQTSEALRMQRRPQNGSSIIPRSDNGKAVEAGTVSLQAQIIIRRKRRRDRDEQVVDLMDVVADRLGQKVTLQLVSVDIDPVTKTGKRSQIAEIKDWADRASVVADKVQYRAEFVIDKSFGIPGALLILNKHQNEFFLESISLTGHPLGPVHFPAHSWVHPEKNSPAERLFFSNQVYLPSSTPKGLQDLREQDLVAHRGDGKGVRQEWENVYDYAVYNDLSDVDKDKSLLRPTLGGSKEYPYPRRTRTGRHPSKADPTLESRVPGQATPYVPRDEAFEEIKQDSYFSSAIRGLVQQTVPDLLDHFRGSPEEFDSFGEIDQLYCDGITMQKKVNRIQNVLQALRDLPVDSMLPDLVRNLVNAASDQPSTILKYPLPQILSMDQYAWLRDDEFGRQALAGLNPCAIECLKVFPPVSELDDPELYGPRESAITRDHIEGRLEGYSVDEALKEGKLFMLDYHDVYIPFINRINALGRRGSYASRTLFFLTKEGTLKPLAIELSLPPPNPRSEVLVPGNNSTQEWRWRLAKAHVGCNDAGYHQLVSHWLRTHASTEPYVIATNRQLSPLHPVFKLLHPHFRYTLEINAAARQSLISADGVIEHAFLPGQYSMEMSSAFYGGKWRFDKQALPQDLISRGVAVEDQTSPTGVKLLIEDYPFATDALLVWSTIESWVVDYVSIYYEGSAIIQQDQELQKWWEEIRTCGHADKKDEEWWPQLDSEQNLVQVLTTMIWLNSGFHAAVNFGQFAYAGYMPNKPTLMRRLIPQPDTPEYKEFLADPQMFFLSSLPSQAQSTVLMAVIESLSTHSPDEEYLGSDTRPNWFGCSEAVNAFKSFQERMLSIEEEIHRRNGNAQLNNRNGAGILPYELLLPWSKPGVTGRGIPKSISI